MVYIANWGIICHRSHLLREPETTIDVACQKDYPNIQEFIICTFYVLDLRMFDAKGKSSKHIPPKWWFDGDESHSKKVKYHLQQIQDASFRESGRK